MVLDRFERASMPERLLVLSALGFAAAFAAIVAFEQPGRGFGHFLYLPLILAALATGPFWGAVAGLVAAVLYWVGLFFGQHGSWSHVFSVGGVVRFLSFVLAGVIVGFFARRARRMMGDSLHVLDELLVLASRDLTTGISSGRGFEAAVNRRLAEQRPFVLLVGDRADGARLNGPREDETLRRIASRLSALLERGDELATVGLGHFALLLPCASAGEARAASARLERALDEDGCRMTFGSAMYPQDGDDLLSLFRVADQRLYARMNVRGEWRPTAASAGLVEDLDRLRDVSSA